MGNTDDSSFLISERLHQALTKGMGNYFNDSEHNEARAEYVTNLVFKFDGKILVHGCNTYTFYMEAGYENKGQS